MTSSMKTYGLVTILPDTDAAIPVWVRSEVVRVAGSFLEEVAVELINTEGSSEQTMYFFLVRRVALPPVVSTLNVWLDEISIIRSKLVRNRGVDNPA